ncbi:hypothetical protein EON81_12900 [bacterium]|nr:MAG: hypothetical protein EON81_12900 [bacterium]
MNVRTTVPQCHLLVDRQAIPEEANRDLMECVVENSLHLPDACTVRIHDADFKWLDSGLWHEGKKLEVQVGYGQEPLQSVFIGEITALEMDLAALGVPMLTIRCLDQAHRLHRGRQRRTFEQQTDSDIVRRLARDNGLRLEADDTTGVHPWVIQNNQTDWEFLSMLAERNSFRLYLKEEDKLFFKKVVDETERETELDWGQALRSFRIRAAAAPQVDEVIVRSWNPDDKKAVIGTARRPAGAAEIGERGRGGDVSKQAYGESRMVVVDRPAPNQAEAQKIAQSIMDDIGASFIEADGLCYGHPEIRAGDAVKIKNIGNRFSGRYLVTSATHTYSPAEGFSTQFLINGKRPSTLLTMLGGEEEGAGSANRGNIVVGIVTDNNDPENLGRVRVMYPWLTEDHQSFWARIASPMAGAGRGFMFLPEIDDEVLLAFEHGDIHRPYVLGGLWNGRDRPPLDSGSAIEDGKVRRRRIRTRYGHTIDLDDNGTVHIRTAGGEHFMLADGLGIGFITPTEHQVYATDEGEVAMTTSDGAKVSISEKETTIAMADEGGSNIVSIEYTSGKITVTSMSTIAISATAAVTIDAPSVAINAGAGMSPPTPGGGSGSPSYVPLPPPPPPPLGS